MRHFVLYDGDAVSESNLNRLVIATETDAEAEVPKIEAACREIVAVQKHANVDAHGCRWQEEPHALRGCDLIFACVDSFAQRRELEACARRYLIPLIDIGMDIHEGNDGSLGMAGQVILSMPGGPCLFCLGFLTDEKLAREAANYGAAGGKPQVVWPNGVLASLAVGVGIDLLTDWSRSLRDPVYLSYRGNTGTVSPHVRLKHIGKGPCTPCTHYSPASVGDPVFRSL